MRTFLYLIIFLNLLSCSQQNKSLPALKNMDQASAKEDFNIFFERFKMDSLFQQPRIDNPLPVLTGDEYGNDLETKLQVGYVAFNAKDWRREIRLSTERVDQDTMNVILKVVDTGIYLEHLFARRGGKWYLFKIQDLST